MRYIIDEKYLSDYIYAEKSYYACIFKAYIKIYNFIFNDQIIFFKN